MSARPAEYTAPPHHTFVCTACGKNNPDRTRVGDESCFMHAIVVPLNWCSFDGRRVTRVEDPLEPWSIVQHA